MISVHMECYKYMITGKYMIFVFAFIFI